MALLAITNSVKTSGVSAVSRHECYKRRVGVTHYTLLTVGAPSVIPTQNDEMTPGCGAAYTPPGSGKVYFVIYDSSFVRFTSFSWLVGQFVGQSVHHLGPD